MPSTVDPLAKKIWDYHHLNQPLQRSDILLVLGSHDTRVAERGAQLFLDGWAPTLMFSGGLGNLTRGIWKTPEADTFAAIALRMGVPKEKILIENRSTNTGENVLFSKVLLGEKGMNPRKVLAVHKPYMERRTYATFRKVWPEVEVRVTSPQISFENYPNDQIPKKDVIAIMVGDLQRIRLYAEKGFQVAQEIPPEVWKAYDELVRLGFTAHLLRT